MIEVFKKVRRNTNYSVSNLGSIRNDKNNKILKPFNSTTGYLKVNLGHKVRNIKVHRLVAEAFLKNPHGYPFINHKDLNRKNNKLSNLEWCSPKFNSEHAKKNGVISRPKHGNKGIYNPRAKLTEKQVISIRYAAGTSLQIGNMFGVSSSVVRDIKSRRSWKHI